jgi:hypothetical protein
MSDADTFLRWLAEEDGYTHAVALPGERYACLSLRPYNTQIITGRLGDRGGYSTAW